MASLSSLVVNPEANQDAAGIALGLQGFPNKPLLLRQRFMVYWCYLKLDLEFPPHSLPLWEDRPRS